MTGSCIGNKKTYYSCVNDLVLWELIEYKKGANEWKAPVFKLTVLNRTSSGDSIVPLPAPLLDTQVVTLPTPLPYPVYKLLTDNIKLITDNLNAILIFLKPKELNIPEKEDSLSDEEIEKIKDENNKFFGLGKYEVKNIPEGF